MLWHGTRQVVGASFLTLASLVVVGTIFFCVNEDW